ncbi:hypothetical protein C0J45_12456 [Silurus meridionalis]|nr:hypothetical protein C0J45_12456 [Silurus meridionalis]
MSPHVSSPRIRPIWSPTFWGACVVLMFARVQALVPSEATPPKRSEEQRGVGDTPLFPGVLTTPLTTTSKRACNTQLSKHTALFRYDIKGFSSHSARHV